MGPCYVLDAVRTPFGRYGGALAGERPDDLATVALRGLLDRSPGLDPERIDDVLLLLEPSVTRRKRLCFSTTNCVEWLSGSVTVVVPVAAPPPAAL